MRVAKSPMASANHSVRRELISDANTGLIVVGGVDIALLQLGANRPAHEDAIAIGGVGLSTKHTVLGR